MSLSSSSLSLSSSSLQEYTNIILEKRWSELYYQQFVLRHFDKLDWTGISSNPNITMSIINKHPEHPWIGDITVLVLTLI